MSSTSSPLKSATAMSSVVSLVLLPLGAEEAARPVVERGQREGARGSHGQAGCVQAVFIRGEGEDSAWVECVLGKEDLVRLVAVGHDKVQLVVLVQVDRHDLGRRRVEILANWACRGEVARRRG